MIATKPFPITTTASEYFPPGRVVNRAPTVGLAEVTVTVVGEFVPLAAPLPPVRSLHTAVYDAAVRFDWDPDKDAAARQAGELAMTLVRHDVRPSSIVTVNVSNSAMGTKMESSR